MLGNTSNYNNLMSTLSRLNSAVGKLNNQQQTANASGTANFSNSISSSGSNFVSSFGGFQQQVGQRYSMPEGQTTQLLQMFANVLEDLIGEVVNNSARHNGGQDRPGVNGQQSTGSNNSSQSTNQWSGQADNGAQTDRTERDSGQQDSGRTERQEARRTERQEARRAERQDSGADKASQSSANSGSGDWRNNLGRSDAARNVASTQAVDATDSTSSASGGEAAQVHKSGGCPFMAMESEQSSDSGSTQSNNSNASSNSGNNQNTKPEGAAGPAGWQGKPAGGGIAETAPAKPVGHPQEPAGSTTETESGKPDGGIENNQPAQGAAEVDKADNREIDFSKLSKSERADIGLDTRERAVIHLWGRQMMSAGEQNGGIYTNVLGADGTGSGWANKDEVALVQELRAQENEKFGTDTGWMLDEAYFEIMKDKTGVDMSARYADRPVKESTGPVVISNDLQAVEQRSGLSGFEQGVMRLMGHDALMDGEFDGSVLEYTVGNANSLDSNKHSGGNAIDDMAKALLAQDKADDGEVNGSSIMSETVKTLDRLYA